MTPEQRAELIDQLDRSFMVLPTWTKTAVKHSMGAPETNPKTGKPFTSFREVIEVSSDETLEILRQDFEDNGDLLLKAIADGVAELEQNQPPLSDREKALVKAVRSVLKGSTPNWPTTLREALAAYGKDD